MLGWPVEFAVREALGMSGINFLWLSTRKVAGEEIGLLRWRMEFA